MSLTFPGSVFGHPVHTHIYEFDFIKILFIYDNGVVGDIIEANMPPSLEYYAYTMDI